MDRIRAKLTFSPSALEAKAPTKIMVIDVPRVPMSNDKIVLLGRDGLPTCFWVSDVYLNVGRVDDYSATCFLYEGGTKASHADLLGEISGGFGSNDFLPTSRDEPNTVGSLISHLLAYPEEIPIYAWSSDYKPTGPGFHMKGNELFISVENEDD